MKIFLLLTQCTHIHCGDPKSNLDPNPQYFTQDAAIDHESYKTWI